MSSSYTLKFSDPTTSTFIVVQGTSVGTGKNNYDTSLELVGPGYVNFGQAVGQNFVRLLENFSSPFPPLNPIKGQLWYDTSNPDRYVLRINNGSVTSSRWPAANGIYQQPNDPYVEYPSNIKEGDVWVDTSVNQLKIRYATGWTLVGPGTEAGANKSGSEAVTLQSNTGSSYPVILNWVDGKVVEVISYRDFTPRTVIEGFSTIKAGTNLTSKNYAKYNGVAERASALELPNGLLVRASEVLKNRAPTQTHTGTFVIESGIGLVVKSANNAETLRAYTTSSGGTLKAFADFSNTASNSTFKVGITDLSYAMFNSNGTVGINTSTASATLDVHGAGKFLNTLTVATTAPTALSVGGGIVAGGPISAAGARVTGYMTVTNILTLGASGSGVIINPIIDDVYDLGTTSTRFRHIYASGVGSIGTTKFYGTLTGAASLLHTERAFSVSGQVTSTIVQFNGATDVVLTATITASAISGQTKTETTTATQTLLVLNTSTTAAGTLEKVSKKTFLSDVYPYMVPPGSIIPWGKSTAPTDLKPDGKYSWLLCNGSPYNRNDYSDLFAVISTNYGTTSPPAGQFFVPTYTASDNNGRPLYYIIKT